MDDAAFDRVAKLLSATPRRRTTLGLLVGGALGGFSGLLRPDADAKGKGKGRKKKKKGGHHDRPRGKSCDDCNVCQTCKDSDKKCRPDASKNGQPCSGCLTCANGACGIGDDALCPNGQRCRQSTGVCCPKCLDGQCCPVGSTCINPGLLSANSCCDNRVNTPCGSNGDGTFRECCSSFNEACVNDTCVPKDECAGRQLAAGETCCSQPEQTCRNADGTSHCCSGDQVCCKADGTNHYQSNDVCCDPGRCLAPGVCCAPDAELKCPGPYAHCAPPDNVCCGEYSCPDCSTCRVSERVYG